MSNIAVKVSNISKKFIVKSERIFSDKKSPFKTFFQKFLLAKHEEFWALKDISFEINEGESIGFMGMNGAGKSTLLKILCDIIRPTSGKVEIRGKLAAILELGVGFHPELSGRDNILLYGKTLGFSTTQIESKFDEIVDFSEINAFIDEPIKHYSSGMLMRLGFAVIAFLETDIILLDEILSVGDISFRNKCTNRIIELKNQGKTIIIVSHDLNEISNYCDKIFLFHEGNLIASGGSITIFNQYQHLLLYDKELKKNPQHKKYNKFDANILYNNYISNLKTSVNFENINFNAQVPSFDIISASIKPHGNDKTKPSEFRIDEEIIISINAKYCGGKSDLAFVIRDTMNNKVFGGFVFSQMNIKIEEGQSYEFNWKIPSNVFNEGIFKLGILFFNEQNNYSYEIREVLIFATTDLNKPENGLVLYAPIKPLMEFSYSKLN